MTVNILNDPLYHRYIDLQIDLTEKGCAVREGYSFDDEVLKKIKPPLYPRGRLVPIPPPTAALVAAIDCEELDAVRRGAKARPNRILILAKARRIQVPDPGRYLIFLLRDRLPETLGFNTVRIETVLQDFLAQDGGDRSPEEIELGLMRETDGLYRLSLTRYSLWEDTPWVLVVRAITVIQGIPVIVEISDDRIDMATVDKLIEQGRIVIDRLLALNGGFSGAS